MMTVLQTLIALLLLVHCCLCDYPDFDTWKSSAGRDYALEDERDYRQLIYYTTVVKISKHNADPTQTYRMGLNHFADMTFKEYKLTYLRAQPNDIEVPDAS